MLSTQAKRAAACCEANANDVEPGGFPSGIGRDHGMPFTFTDNQVGEVDDPRTSERRVDGREFKYWITLPQWLLLGQARSWRASKPPEYAPASRERVH